MAEARVLLRVERKFEQSPERVFALGLDPGRFPATFRGFGPIPAVERITPHAPPALGSTRELENSDGSRLIETITALDPPRRHGYSLRGLRPPLAWLVTAGHAVWTFQPVGAGSRVRWSYDWEVRHPLLWPLAWLLLKGFMRPAMRRCLNAMAEAL